MDEKHAAILRDHYVKLKKELEPEKVLSHLFQGKVFDQDDKDTVRAIQTREGKSGELIDMLLMKPPHAFDVFVSALEIEQPHLACPLLRAEISNMSAEKEKKEIENENILKELEEIKRQMKADPSVGRKKGKRLEEAVQKKDELEENYKRLCEENKRIEDKCKELERQLKEASEMEAVKKKLETVEKEKKNLEKELSVEREKKEQWQKDLKNATDQNNKLLEEYKKLEDKNKQQKHKHALALTGFRNAVTPLLAEMGATSRPSSAQIGDQLSEEMKTIQEESDEKNELFNSAEKGLSIPNAQMGATSRPSSAQIGDQLMEGMKKLQEESDEKNKPIPKARVFSYRSDFDEKGVIYALGTNFGKNPYWVNPGGKKAPHPIIVTRSSEGLGKPKDLLNYKKEKTSNTDRKPDSWWCLDLGEKFSLFLTHYTLRHGRNDIKSYLKNWDLQGSHDGENWVVLDSQRNHQWYKTPFKYMSKTWPIEGKVEAFRFFRVFQTGENSTGRFDICLSGMELYGVLLNMSPRGAQSPSA